MNKTSKIRDLWVEMASDKRYSKLKKPLVNHYLKHNFIPNKWFDWESKVNAPIMIIGQDWGPYSALEKYVKDYEERKDEADFNYVDFLYATFSSRTEKFIMKAIEEITSKPAIENDNLFFFTIAVMFTRGGKHFRGNDNFDPKESLEHSFPYLSKQIDIVKPKVIVTLGGMALDQVARHFKLRLEGKNLTEIINKLGDKVIEVADTIIIPNFHPAAHISPKIQMKIWQKALKQGNYFMNETLN